MVAGVSEVSTIDYDLTTSEQVLLTSAAGAKLAQQPNVTFKPGRANRAVNIQIFPGEVRQTLLGIGTSFSEASAFVLAHLMPEQRAEVMARIYGEQGADFTLARTPIGATDFCVEGRYSYAPVDADIALEHFDIGVDRDGFSAAKYSGIRDPDYDLLPMIHEALAIKGEQQDSTLRIMASAWTAPPWMKDIEDWYRDGSGGSLKPEYVATYADYLVRYLDAYAEAGVSLWSLTPVNEPQGNNGQWESMHFSAESQRDFIKRCVGLPGDKVEVIDQHLYINDHLVEDSSYVFYNPHNRYRQHYGPATVAEGEFFCMGDNRDNSRDSRSWGGVPAAFVKGRAFMIYWSYDAERQSLEWTGYWDKIRQLAGVTRGFFTNTRWNRSFTIVR